MDWGTPSIRGRVLDDLMRFTRQQRGIFLKLDPDVVLGRGIPGSQEASKKPTDRRCWRNWPGEAGNCRPIKFNSAIQS